MPIALASDSLEHLPRAPLKLALVQVKYRPLVVIEQPERVAAFQDAVVERFELVDRQTSQALQVEVSPAGVNQRAGQTETVWQFRAMDGGATVALSATSLGFESAEYDAFERFADQFAYVLEAVAATFGPRHQTRLGVRYVNEVVDERLAPNTLIDFLNDDLVRPVGSELGVDLIGGLSELRFQQPDGIFVLRHGLVRPNTYLLDFDYYNETERPFDAAAALEVTHRFHTVIEAVFKWSLAEGYLGELRQATS
jgi:uncharacterized protein (TIGR04255 family)